MIRYYRIPTTFLKLAVLMTTVLSSVFVDGDEESFVDNPEDAHYDDDSERIHFLNHFSADVQIGWWDPDPGQVKIITVLQPDKGAYLNCMLGDVFEFREVPNDEGGECSSKDGDCRRAMLQLEYAVSQVPYIITENFEVIKVIPVTELTYTWTDFDVAGVNLAQYEMGGGAEVRHDDGEDGRSSGTHHFELYEDFNIAHLIRGYEEFHDLVNLSGSIQKSTLSFYEDKVAIKRWLPQQGFSIPGLYALNYASELRCGMQEKSLLSLLPNQTEAILGLLPTGQSEYVAKPSHKAESYDVWVVRENANSRDSSTLQVSKDNAGFEDEEDFHPYWVADSLAKGLYERPDEWEAWALLNVKPGVVVEERFTSLDGTNGPPYEFKFFTIWGRVWVAEWVIGRWRAYMEPGFVHRNGTMVQGSERKLIPDWVDWPHMVDIAERLGRHKDLMRIDMFAGVPSGSQRRRTDVEYVINELEFEPETPMLPRLAREGRRLWMAGYNLLNYTIIPNSEVPSTFLEPDMPFSSSSCV